MGTVIGDPPDDSPLRLVPAAGHVYDAPLCPLPVGALVRVASAETIAQIHPGLFEVAPRKVEGRGALLASTPNQLGGLEL